MEKKFSYDKEEKLKSRKLTEKVFSEGKTFSVFPLKIFYFIVEEEIDFDVKVGVGASKKNFKKAVDRNRIKRLLREAYRKEKLLLYDLLKKQKTQVAVFILYIDKILPGKNIIENKMPLALKKLVKLIDEKNAANI